MVREMGGLDLHLLVSAFSSYWCMHVEESLFKL